MADPLFSGPTGTTSYRNLFHDQISKWETGIPLQTLWVARFSFPDTSIIPGIPDDFSTFYNNIGVDIDMDSHQIFGINLNDQFTVFNSNINNQIGCFYIQSIKLPVDSFATKDADLDAGAGGFLTGVVGSDRAKNSSRSLTIDFLETNLDFIDLIIRPWMVTAAYRGLLARKTRNFKANIEIVQFTRSTESDKRIIRKKYQFFDCVPTNIPGNPLTYTTEEVRTVSVQWAYNTYTYNNNMYSIIESND